MNRILKATRSLCAVLLAFAVSLSAFSLYLKAADEDSANAGETESDKNYRYEIEVEFSSFAFYYDYGTWNVNTMSYEADKSSDNPSANTVKGYPGWYGFDGISNMIRVKNLSKSDVAKDINVEIRFEIPTKDDEYRNKFEYLLDPNCIKMDVYEYAAGSFASDTWKNAKMSDEAIAGLEVYKNFGGTIEEFLNTHSLVHIPNTADNKCSFNIGTGITREVFLSFSGAPKMADGSDFTTSISAAVGFVTLKIDFAE